MKWFPSLRRGGPGSIQRKPARARLRAELLEDRVVPVVFSPPSFYPVGGGPQLIAVGAYNTNNDDFLDLAVSNQDGTVSILLNDGSGNFYPGSTIQLAGRKNPEGIVTGDFNGDGKLDLAVASYGEGNTPGAVDVLLGNGDGTFRLGTPLFLPFQAGPTYLATADFTGDGVLDLAVADFNRNQTLLYRGRPDGTFTLLDSLTGNGQVNPEQVVFADFNGDGILDLAVANQGNGTVSVFKGTGGGFFTPAANKAAGVGSIGLAVGDFDGDGRPDLAVANYGTDAVPGDVVSVLRNTSAGGVISFDNAQTFFIGDHLINVVAADLDGDGKVDLAVTSYSPSVPENNDVAWLVNTSDGPGSISFDAGGEQVGLFPVGLVAADLNGDGLPDLVNTNFQDDTVSVLLNESGERFRPSHGQKPDFAGQAETLRATSAPTAADSVVTGTAYPLTDGVLHSSAGAFNRNDARDRLSRFAATAALNEVRIRLPRGASGHELFFAHRADYNYGWDPVRGTFAAA